MIWIGHPYSNYSTILKIMFTFPLRQVTNNNKEEKSIEERMIIKRRINSQPEHLLDSMDYGVSGKEYYNYTT